MKKNRYGTSDVLKVYKRVNPSKVPSTSSARGWEKYRATWTNFVTGKLLLPRLAFDGASLLDAGCGTGEKSCVYASLGAHVTGFDANERAVAAARALAEKLGLAKRASFKVADVASLKKKASFDIVVSDGMLHHTPDPWGGLARVADRVAPGGILVLGLAEPCGFFQRTLQRYFVNRLAGDSETRKVEIASILFGDIVARAAKRSGRSVQSTIYDSFVNPIVEPMALPKIEKELARKGFSLDLSWPPTGLIGEADSQYHEKLSRSHPAQVAAIAAARASWISNDVDDADRFALPGRELASWLEKLCAMTADATDLHFPSAKARALTASAPKGNAVPVLTTDIVEDACDILDEAARIDGQISRHLSSGMSPQAAARRIKFIRLFKGYSGVGMVYYRFTRKR